MGLLVIIREFLEKVVSKALSTKVERALETGVCHLFRSTYPFTHAHICIYPYTYTRTLTYAYIYAYLGVYIYIERERYLSKSMHTYACIYIYIYIERDISKSMHCSLSFSMKLPGGACPDLVPAGVRGGDPSITVGSLCVLENHVTRRLLDFKKIKTNKNPCSMQFWCWPRRRTQRAAQCISSLFSACGSIKEPSSFEVLK
jgi:hypothetical protein